MVADDLYEKALPVLQDEALDEEDKTDKLEELLRRGDKPYRQFLQLSSQSSSHHPPALASSLAGQPRPDSPINDTPRMVHPPPGFGIGPPGFARTKASLSAYQFSECASPNTESDGDLDGHPVDWLVRKNAASTEFLPPG
ncbi:unnamed protein product [Alternaria alternata]